MYCIFEAAKKNNCVFHKAGNKVGFPGKVGPVFYKIFKVIVGFLKSIDIICSVGSYIISSGCDGYQFILLIQNEFKDFYICWHSFDGDGFSFQCSAPVSTMWTPQGIT